MNKPTAKWERGVSSEGGYWVAAIRVGEQDDVERDFGDADEEGDVDDEAEADGVSVDELVDRLLDLVPVP